MNDQVSHTDLGELRDLNNSVVLHAKTGDGL